MWSAAKTSWWRPSTGLPWLALIALVAVVFLIDRQGVGAAAGQWTVTHMTPGQEGPHLTSKIGDQVTVRRNGYVSLPQPEGRVGILGRALCGWNCFSLRRLRLPHEFRLMLSDDLNSFTLTGSSGFVMRAERRLSP